MNGSEILLAALFNVREVFIVVLIIISLSILFALLRWLIENDCDKDKFPRTFFKWSIMIAVPSLIIACIPTVDQLWKVRIGLIKLELSSPENIKSGAEVIERIGLKLECKYLGCEEKKSK